MHGGQAIGKRDTESERILEFAFANELVVGNTWVKKKSEHLVTYQSGNAATQIDFILYRRSFRKQVSNINIKSEMRSFKSNVNIHKKEGGSYYVVSANKASSVTL